MLCLIVVLPCLVGTYMVINPCNTVATYAYTWNSNLQSSMLQHNAYKKIINSTDKFYKKVFTDSAQKLLG